MRNRLEIVTMLAIIFTLLAGCTVNINPIKRSVAETVYYGEGFLEDHHDKAGNMEKTDVDIVQTIDSKTVDPQITDSQIIDRSDTKNQKEDVDEGTSYAVKVPVLLYHHLLKKDENIFSDNKAIISVESFEEQMRVVYEEGYKTISLEELRLFLSNEMQLPRKSILITFDDGYKSNVQYAYPILKKYNFKAAIFIVSSMICEETSEFDPKMIQFISWEEMEEHSDVFEYACHTHNFHRLENGKSYLVTKPREELMNDLRMNLETMKNPYFAYPYSEYNSETIKILKELGFIMAFSTISGDVRPGDNMFTLKRRSIRPDMDIEKFKKILR